MPRWFLWSLVAVLCWGLWAVISKLIGGALTAAQSQALSTIGLIPVAAVLLASKRLTASGNYYRGISAAFGAGTLACVGNVAFYHALSLGGKAATLVPLTALYPLITIALALILLRERLNAIQVAGLILSLAAIYRFNVADDLRGEIGRVEGHFSGSLAYALSPIVFWGVAGLLQKISTNHISGELSTLWFLAAFVPVAVVILVVQPIPGNIAFKTWLLVITVGLFLSLGNLGILAAFANAGKASIITPLTGLYPVVSVPVAIFFLGEEITAREKGGIVLALISVIALSYEKSATPTPSTTQEV